MTTFKRTTSKHSYRTDAICMHCNEAMDYESSARSLTWFGRIPGVRARLCSEVCREAWDAANPTTTQQEGTG